MLKYPRTAHGNLLKQITKAVVETTAFCLIGVYLKDLESRHIICDQQKTIRSEEDFPIRLPEALSPERFTARSC